MDTLAMKNLIEDSITCLNETSDQQVPSTDSEELYNDNMRPLNSYILHDGPEILQRLPSMIEANAGDTVRFECKVAGTPKPQVKWMKNEEDLTGNISYCLDEWEEEEGYGYGMMIEKVAYMDEGTYKCIAWNEEGTTSSITFLSVNDKNARLSSRRNRPLSIIMERASQEIDETKDEHGNITFGSGGTPFARAQDFANIFSKRIEQQDSPQVTPHSSLEELSSDLRDSGLGLKESGMEMSGTSSGALYENLPDEVAISDILGEENLEESLIETLKSDQIVPDCNTLQENQPGQTAHIVHTMPGGTSVSDKGLLETDIDIVMREDEFKTEPATDASYIEKPPEIDMEKPTAEMGNMDQEEVVEDDIELEEKAVQMMEQTANVAALRRGGKRENRHSVILNEQEEENVKEAHHSQLESTSKVPVIEKASEPEEPIPTENAQHQMIVDDDRTNRSVAATNQSEIKKPQQKPRLAKARSFSEETFIALAQLVLNERQLRALHDYQIRWDIVLMLIILLTVTGLTANLPPVWFAFLTTWFLSVYHLCAALL